MAEERELIFKKMGMQITNLKYENEDLAKELRRLKDNKSCMEKEFFTERLTIEQARNNVNEELKKTK